MKPMGCSSRSERGFEQPKLRPNDESNDGMPMPPAMLLVGNGRGGATPIAPIEGGSTPIIPGEACGRVACPLSDCG